MNSEGLHHNKPYSPLQVENIIEHGINCFVNRQLIYNFPEEIFADAGVMAIEHADFDGIERLALVTGQPQVPHSKDWRVDLPISPCLLKSLSRGFVATYYVQVHS